MGEADVGVSVVRQSVRHNHQQNQESRRVGGDADFGLSPQRCKVYHNQESAPDAGAPPQPKWKSRINDSAFTLHHEPEVAAASMEQNRRVKPDLVNKPQRGPIKYVQFFYNPGTGT